MGNRKPVVGETLYFYYYRNRRYGEDVTVTSVGRKWANLSNRYRIDIASWYADGAGFASPGRAWENEAACDEAAAVAAAWADFKRDVGNHRPGEPPTVEAINTARRAIGLSVLGEPGP